MARKWINYNEALVKHEEVLLSFDFKKRIKEKEEEDIFILYSFIKILGFIHFCFKLPFRQLEGF